MTIKEAAERLGMNPQTLRMALIQKLFDFGVAIKTSKNRYTYYINEYKLYEYLGEEMINNEVKRM